MLKYGYEILLGILGGILVLIGFWMAWLPALIVFSGCFFLDAMQEIKNNRI